MIQYLSTSTYLPLPKVGRLCYIDRYCRFTRFTPLLTNQLSCRSPQSSPKVQIKVLHDTLKFNTLMFPRASFIFLVDSYLLLSPARVMHCNYSSSFLEEGASISPQPFLVLNKISWVKSCFTMLSYVVDFTHQLVFPSNFFHGIETVSEFLPKKKRTKAPATRKVVGSWLCFYAMIGFLCWRMQKRVLCCIARSKQAYFYVVLQGKQRQLYFWCCKKRLYCKHARTISQPSKDTRTQQSNFYMLSITRMMTMIAFFSV